MNKNNKEKKRFYPKRMSMEEAQYNAIVILRDCADFPFTRIAKVLGFKNSSTRNMQYYYERNKNKYLCARITKAVEKTKKVVSNSGESIIKT